MEFPLSFLVYDSRSGSTILSKVLAKRIANLQVTPEIAFDELLQARAFSMRQLWAGERGVTSRQWKRLLGSGGLRNLASQDEIHRLLPELDREHSGSAIRSLLGLHLSGLCSSTGSKNDPVAATILVKNGSHLKYVTQLRDAFGSHTPFLFLHRDPRDVIASKTITPRPYVPSEMMAWGGVFVAAIRWNRYARLALKARKQGARILFVSYEQFVMAPDEVIAEIAQFLNLSNNMQACTSDYHVPEHEQSIHQLALQGTVVSTRLNSWHQTLARYDVVALEFLCRDSMAQLGYLPKMAVGRTDRLMCLSKAAAVSLRKVVKRYASRIF